MIHPNLRKHKITNKMVANSLGYKNVKAFYQSTAHKRIIQGVDDIVGIVIENIKSKI